MKKIVTPFLIAYQVAAIALYWMGMINFSWLVILPMILIFTVFSIAWIYVAVVNY